MIINESMNNMNMSKELLSVDSNIRSFGIIKNGNTNLNFKEATGDRDNNSLKLSFDQIHHIMENAERFSKDLGKIRHIVFEYDKTKLFSMPVKDEIITFETSRETDNEEFMNKVFQHFFKSPKEEGLKTAKEPGNRDGKNLSKNVSPNTWQKYAFSNIELWKEFVIASIQINEKMVKSFWRNFSEKQ